MWRPFFLLLLIYPSLLLSQNYNYGITEKLGGQIPGDIIILNSDSVPVNLKQLIDKPTFLAFVYYQCPGICTTVLNGIVEVMNKSTLRPGIDYQVMAISINHNETPFLAKKKEKNYLGLLKLNQVSNALRFYTADSLTIKKITDSTGFQFQFAGKDIIHPTCLIAVSPKGTICHYLNGNYYLPSDLELTVKDARNEIANASRIKKINYCYSKPHEIKKGIFEFVLTSEIFFVTILFVILFILIYRKRKHFGEKYT